MRAFPRILLAILVLSSGAPTSAFSPTSPLAVRSTGNVLSAEAFASRLLWIRRSPAGHLFHQFSRLGFGSFSEKRIPFHWLIPDPRDAETQLELDASGLAATDLLSIRKAGKPLVQRLMETGDHLFQTELSRWIQLYPSPSVQGQRRTQAHVNLARQIGEDVSARLFGSRILTNRLAPVSVIPFLSVTGWAGYWVGLHGIARHFIRPGSAENFKAIQCVVRGERNENALVTLCLAGEQATTDEEAIEGVHRLRQTLTHIRRQLSADEPLHLAIKFSALVANFNPADAEHLQKALERGRSIISDAHKAGVEVEIDGETFADRAAQISLFKALAAELPAGQRLSVVVQAYFRDSDKIIDALVSHSAAHRYPLGIRLVKGAYYEAEAAAGAPVWESRSETNAHYQKLTRQLMRYAAERKVYPMIASMNPREQAWAFKVAENVGLAPTQWESQMLFGMQEHLLRRLIARRQRVRLYTLVADDVIAGAKYFDRRRAEFRGDAISHSQFDERRNIESLAAIGHIRPAPLYGVSTSHYHRRTVYSLASSA